MSRGWGRGLGEEGPQGAALSVARSWSRNVAFELPQKGAIPKPIVWAMAGADGRGLVRRQAGTRQALLNHGARFRFTRPLDRPLQFPACHRAASISMERSWIF